jgi:NAD(P)-dependent dehydrogenase (short-subunit alcohol dehydrogenase family)
MSKVWFITGCSRGFGRHWLEGALRRGDKVAATARRPETLDEIADRYGDAVLALKLDVTDRPTVFDAVARAHRHFGRLDVVVNNAGYGLFGAIEEVSEELARAQMETNFFGALWVTQAALPFMRAQGHGHFLQVSSMGGIVALPMVGLYNASKWALEAISDSLFQEVAQYGIRVTLIEPGPYDTDWRGSSGIWADEKPGYSTHREARRQRTASITQADPAATTAAIMKVVDADDPPLRLLLGTLAMQLCRSAYEERLKTWAAWDEISRAAQGDAG